MKTIRIVLWALVALVSVGLGAAALRGGDEPVEVAAIGGPFTLVNQRGETVTRDDLVGKPHAVFFGYTFCPDVCPTTLWEMSEHLKALDAGGKGDLEVVFITVDPARDTPETLEAYVSAFDERILALTGSREAVDEAVRAYKATYRIHPEDENGDVLVDHTASVFLFDGEGRFRGTIAYGEAMDTARAKLARLVEA